MIELGVICAKRRASGDRAAHVRADDGDATIEIAMKHRSKVVAGCRLARRGAMMFGLLLTGACPSDSGDDPDCDFDDLSISGHLSAGLEGPRCDPCSAGDQLFVVADVTTTCGVVEWSTSQTCLVREVVATPEDGGEQVQFDGDICPDGFGSWRVAPDEPLVVSGPALDAVFEMSIPAGTFTFEIGIDDGVGLAYGTFTTTIAAQ